MKFAIDLYDTNIHDTRMIVLEKEKEKKKGEGGGKKTSKAKLPARK